MMSQTFARATEALNAYKMTIATEGPKVMFGVLKRHVEEIDMKSRDLVKKFKKKEIDLQTFISEYTPIREKVHEYTAKLSILGKILFQ